MPKVASLATRPAPSTPELRPFFKESTETRMNKAARKPPTPQIPRLAGGRLSLPRSARLTNPTSTTGHPRRATLENHPDPAARLRSAIRKARAMQRVLKSGDEDVLIQSTLMQGLLSGDVMAASIRARLKLQRENQSMRRRLTMSRIRTENVKQRLLAIEADRREKPDTPLRDVLYKIRVIYGLNETNPPLLLTAQNPVVDIVSEAL